MKHKATKTERKNYISLAFDKLGDQDQAYIEVLTAQLAKIHETTPAKQETSGKAPGDRLKLNKGID
jgi:hypothetical protein